MTYSELRGQVARFAAALKSHGIKVGDRVTGYMPNCMETVIAMLATASIGTYRRIFALAMHIIAF
jgi:acetoacetyl-CoA synthetase